MREFGVIVTPKPRLDDEFNETECSHRHSIFFSFLITVVHLIAGRYLIAGTPPNLTQVKIWEYLKMETLIEHD
jgi:hypothetical protein